MTQLSLAELSLLPTQGAASDSPDLRRKGNYSRGWRSVPRWLPKEEPPVLSCEWKDGSQATVQWVGVPRRIQGGRVRGRDVSCPGVASVEVHCPPPPQVCVGTGCSARLAQAPTRHTHARLRCTAEWREL